MFIIVKDRHYNSVMPKIFLASILMHCMLLCSSLAQNVVEIDRLLSAYQGENPGASLLIVKDGKVLLQRAYGYADLKSKEPVTAATNFRLASVSKQFTAACILQLIDQGKLTLGTTLTEAFPGFPTYGSAVTVKHLLTHTSGIPDYEDYVPDTAFNPQLKDQGVLTILMQLDSTYFTPGTQYRYSNSAYALLALMVEKYTGKSFASYLHERIFQPLGMNHTLAYEAGEEEVTTRAYGYDRDKHLWKLQDQSSTSAVLGDGGIYSNVLDLFKWDQSLYTDKILPHHWLKAAFSYNHLEDGQTVDYGYGWHLKRNNKGKEVVYHTGSSTSFRNILYRIPTLRFSILLLTNRNHPQEEDMLTLAEKIAELID